MIFFIPSKVTLGFLLYKYTASGCHPCLSPPHPLILASSSRHFSSLRSFLSCFEIAWTRWRPSQDMCLILIYGILPTFIGFLITQLMSSCHSKIVLTWKLTGRCVSLHKWTTQISNYLIFKYIIKINCHWQLILFFT